MGIPTAVAQSNSLKVMFPVINCRCTYLNIEKARGYLAQGLLETYLKISMLPHGEKILIKIIVHYSCSIFIFLFILYCRIVKNMVLCMKFYVLL